MTDKQSEIKLADPTEVYLGTAYLHEPSGKVMITTPHPDEEHNCDAMGCGSIGPHVIQWLIGYFDHESAIAKKEGENADLRQILQTIFDTTTDTVLKSKLAMWLSEQKYV